MRSESAGYNALEFLEDIVESAPRQSPPGSQLRAERMRSESAGYNATVTFVYPSRLIETGSVPSATGMPLSAYR